MNLSDFKFPSQLFCSKKRVCFLVIGITQNNNILYSFSNESLFLHKNCAPRKEYRLFFVVIKNMIVGWEEMLKNTVGYMSTMVEQFFLFSVNFKSEKIIVKSECLKRSHNKIKIKGK